MEADVAADEVDDGIRVGVDGCAGNVLVPGIVSGEGPKSTETAADPKDHGVAGLRGHRWICASAAPAIAAGVAGFVSSGRAPAAGGQRSR